MGPLPYCYLVTVEYLSNQAFFVRFSSYTVQTSVHFRGDGFQSSGRNTRGPLPPFGRELSKR